MRRARMWKSGLDLAAAANRIASRIGACGDLSMVIEDSAHAVNQRVHESAEAHIVS